MENPFEEIHRRFDRLEKDLSVLALLIQNQKTPSYKKELISMKQLCAELNLSRTSINRLIRQGVLPIMRLPNSRRIYFERSKVIDAMTNHKK